MKALAQAFLKQEDWKNFDLSDSPPDLGQEIFKGANFTDQIFESLLARGCTFENSYFTKCRFIGCDFNNSEFSGCVFDRCEFVNCQLGKLVLVESSCSSVDFQSCSAGEILVEGGALVGCGVFACQITRLLCNELSDCRVAFRDSPGMWLALEGSNVSVSFEHCRNSQLETSGENVDVSALSTTFENISFSDYSQASIRMRDCELLRIGLGGKDKGLVIHAFNSILFEPDLFKVDLCASTFAGCSIIEGRWPSQDGRTSFLGRFVPPDNLLGEPVDDVMGVSDIVRRSISRSQALVSLENRHSESAGALALHRVVGLTTGHGRSPLRLVLFSFLPAIILGALHAVYVCTSDPLENVDSVASFSDFISVVTSYYSLVIGFGDRSNIALLPALESVAWFFSVLFLGLVVTLFSNFLFRQG